MDWKFIKHGAFSYAVIVVNILTSVIAVRENINILQKELYGVWILAFSTVGLMGILNLGFSSVAVFRFADHKSESKMDVFHSSNFFILILQSIATIIAFAIIYNISDVFVLDPKYRNIFRTLLLLIIPGTLFNIGSAYIEGILYYNLKFIYHRNILEFYRISVFNVVIVIGLYLTKDVLFMAISYSALSLVALLYSLYKFKTREELNIHISKIDTSYLTTNFKDGFSFWALGTSAFVISQTDVFFISSFLTDIGLVTLYSQSFRLQELALRFIKKLTELKGPKVLALINSKNHKAVVDIYLKLLALNFLLSGVAMVGIILFGKKVLQIWLKNEIVFDQTLISVLSIICLTSSIHWVLWNFCNLAGYQNKVRNVVLAEVVINLLLSYCLIRQIGLIGLPIASIISNGITIIFEIRLFLSFKEQAKQSQFQKV